VCNDDDIWDTDAAVIAALAVDESTMRATGKLPRCRSECGALARPNVLMFGDSRFDPRVVDEQEERFAGFLDAQRGALVVVEIGAGKAVPTVRWTSERAVEAAVADGREATLVRINPRECDGPDKHCIGIPMGGLAALREIERLVDAAAA
jgi:NAD-dependent SIR2 family protein deacetylase